MTYSKIQNWTCRIPKATPIKWFLIKKVHAMCPLSHLKCVKKCNLLMEDWWGVLRPSQESTPLPRLGWGVPPVGTGWGTSQLGLDGIHPTETGWGTPPSHRDWMGVPPLPIGTGWGCPQLRLDGGTRSPPLRLGDRAATRRAVCLLRSRRRTFLLSPKKTLCLIGVI